MLAIVPPSGHPWRNDVRRRVHATKLNVRRTRVSDTWKTEEYQEGIQGSQGIGYRVGSTTATAYRLF